MNTTLIRDNRDAAARALDARILAHIGGTRDEDAFDRLALDVYAYQYERNVPYRRYCERMASDPSRASSWRDVPAVPAASFADVRLACFGSERTALAFVSSGTTSAGGGASRHDLDATELYDASLLAQYRALVMPDVAALPHVFLAPPYSEAPKSSLSYMLSAIDRRFGAPGGGFLVHEDSLDFDGVCDALTAGMPSVVFGTAFAFVHFADRCRSERRRFSLPSGSRVVETGGFKGKSREVSRGDLYRSFEELFGVAPAFCVSEYGMCELGSQWYDANLADRFGGCDPRYHVKIGPHWARTLVVDPVTALPLAKGETGLLRIFDLSNRGSVCAILTGDLARERDGGIEIIGRHPGAPPKGCSIAADAMLGGGGT
jgi:acyl-protein synthetase LuxE